MKPDDVALNKASIIERCIKRMHDEYKADPDLEDYTHIDALTLNIERACQAGIDLAMHVVATQHLGIPQSSGDAFSLLRQADLISFETEQAMRAMVGFRNIAVHQYQEVNMDILRHIAETAWGDLQTYCEALGLRIETTGKEPSGTGEF